jgi:hypothetical protein
VVVLTKIFLCVNVSVYLVCQFLCMFCVSRGTSNRT